MIPLLAIVIELNGVMEENVRKTWELLRAQFGIQWIASRSPAPHIALEGGFRAEPESVLKLMQQTAEGVSPFPLKADGLGIFVRDTPVIYIRWEMAALLFSWRKKLTAALEGAVPDFQTLRDWLPKTTLAMRDTRYSQLSDILEAILPIPFDQKLHVDHLSLYELSHEHGEKRIGSVSTRSRGGGPLLAKVRGRSCSPPDNPHRVSIVK